MKRYRIVNRTRFVTACAVMLLTVILCGRLIIQAAAAKEPVVPKVSLATSEEAVLAQYLETVCEPAAAARAILLIKAEDGFSIKEAISQYDPQAEYYPNPSSETYMAIYWAEANL